MKTEHTPGPWSTSETDGHLVIGADGCLVCEANEASHESVMFANAALIASAPALLSENARLLSEQTILRTALGQLLAITMDPDLDPAEIEGSNRIVAAQDAARAALEGGGL